MNADLEVDQSPNQELSILTEAIDCHQLKSLDVNGRKNNLLAVIAVTAFNFDSPSAETPTKSEQIKLDPGLSVVFPVFPVFRYVVMKHRLSFLLSFP